MQLWNLQCVLLYFGFALVQYGPTIPPFLLYGMIIIIFALRSRKHSICFLILQSYNSEIVFTLRRIFWTWIFKQCWELRMMRPIEVRWNAFCIIHLLGARSRIQWFEWKWYQWAHIWIFVPQWWKFLRRIGSCGLVESLSLGMSFEVSKDPSHCLPFSLYCGFALDKSSYLLFQYHVFLTTIILPAVMVIDSSHVTSQAQN